MSLKDKTIFVTGANRGIGQALVEEALKRGAKRVYAGTRQALVHTGRLTAARPEFIATHKKYLSKEEVNHADII